MYKCLLWCFMLFAWCANLNAQHVVKGSVLDASHNNEPLIGATIQIHGASAGVVADLDGNFTITVPDGKNVIQVSMIGYKTQVVNVKGKSDVKVYLEEEANDLDELVVVGYGTMKKRDLSGSISQIKSDDIMKGGSTDLAHSLQGKIAGVQVNQSDGAPGAGVTITVRGANSFTTSSQPLYIVDGVPYGTNNSMPTSDANANNTNTFTSPLSMLNPNDIEKIEVLKDASATAIYGSRGANGVVIITTKKGQSSEDSKPVVELNVKLGIQNVAKRIDVLSPYTYALYRNEQYYNGLEYGYPVSNSTPFFPGEWTYHTVGGQPVYNGGTYTPSPEDFLNPGIRTDEYGNTYEVAGSNWQDEIFRTGFSQDYNVSVSNGNSRGWYNFSGNYTKQTGIIDNSGYERYGITMNIGRKINDWLEIGTSEIFSNSVTDFQRTGSENTAVIRSALIFPPSIGPNVSTEQLDELNWLATNPVNYVNGAKDQLKQISWFSSSYVEIKLAPWLRFRQNLGLGYNDAHRGTYYNRHTAEGREPNNGLGGKATNIWKSLTAESILTFDKKWGVHALNVMAGMTFEKGTGESSAMSAKNFPTDYTQDNDMSLALERATISSSTTEQALESFLGRINYTLMDRYIFTASVRTDGSSSFAKNNKWATFLSGAFAWRASEEKFIQDLNIFSNLKFRLSFGQTGNQGIGAYRTLNVLTAANYPYSGQLEAGVSMIDWRGPTNPNLKWETTDQFNAGIDMGFFDNRLSFTVDYYYKKTRDLLQNITIPGSSGFTQMLINSGNVSNEGLEFTLNYDVFHNTPVKWNISANLSFNRNRIGGLSGDQFATSLWSAADEAYLQRNGCPIGTIFGYVEDGFFDNIAEVRAFPQYTNLSDQAAKQMVGEIKYRDLNGDGQITAEDRTIIGDTNPDFIYGLTSNLSWKGLTLSFMLQGSQGNDIMNYNLIDIKLGNEGNITQEAYDTRWTPQTASIAKWPKAIPAYTRSWLFSDRYVENGSYLKMKYITLAYDWIKPFPGVQKINISFTANNLFTITKYSWFDPDVNAGGTNAATPGIDSYSYPSSRSFTLGLNFTF